MCHVMLMFVLTFEPFNHWHCYIYYIDVMSQAHSRLDMNSIDLKFK